MKNYRLDKTAFKKQTVEEADMNQEYWKKKSLSERLAAAWYLTCMAYGYSQENPPKMDKTKFTHRRRIS